MLVLSKKLRVYLTVAATVAAGLVATIPNENVRAPLAGLLVVLAAFGIVPAHLEVDERE